MNEKYKIGSIGSLLEWCTMLILLDKWRKENETPSVALWHIKKCFVVKLCQRGEGKRRDENR
jgi:hypothetical protein